MLRSFLVLLLMLFRRVKPRVILNLSKPRRIPTLTLLGRKLFSELLVKQRKRFTVVTRSRGRLILLMVKILMNPRVIIVLLITETRPMTCFRGPTGKLIILLRVRTRARLISPSKLFRLRLNRRVTLLMLIFVFIMLVIVLKLLVTVIVARRFRQLKILPFKLVVSVVLCSVTFVLFVSRLLLFLVVVFLNRLKLFRRVRPLIVLFIVMKLTRPQKTVIPSPVIFIIVFRGGKRKVLQFRRYFKTNLVARQTQRVRRVISPLT